MNDKYILDGKRAVPCGDLMTWARWFETAKRHVGDTTVGPLRISTIFLGLDHNLSGSGPPLLFETMIFGELPEPYAESYQRRCSTWDEAEAQHKRAVALAIERVAKAAELLGPSA